MSSRLRGLTKVSQSKTTGQRIRSDLHVKSDASSNRHNCLQITNSRAANGERLLVYHAGTGRTVFLGCLKVTTIFIFSFFCLVVAPAHFYAEEQPIWVAGAGSSLNFILYKSSSKVLHDIAPFLYIGMTLKYRTSVAVWDNPNDHRGLHVRPICYLHSSQTPSVCSQHARLNYEIFEESPKGCRNRHHHYERHWQATSNSYKNLRASTCEGAVRIGELRSQHGEC